MIRQNENRILLFIPMAVIAFILVFQMIFVGTADVYASRKVEADYILETADYGKVRDTMSDTWVAVDDLGREVAKGDSVRDVQKEKHVLMFYYTWHGSHTQTVYNIAEILQEGEKTGQYNWGNEGDFHYWGEPYFGYYKSNDPWVIRKDIQMLCDAGIDGVFFDASNAVLYHDAYKSFIEQNLARKAEGQSYLKCTWMIRNGNVTDVLRTLYETYYLNEDYADALYMIDGKPLMLCPADAPADEFENYFAVRDCWAWAGGEGKWPWLENYPQIGGWAAGNTELEREMVSVSAAQHPTTNIGKSFSGGLQPDLADQTPERGIYFSEQWAGALDLDPQFVLITQWNEWMAQRFLSGSKQFYAGKRIEKDDTYFVDVYSAEYSRDIAPMRGGYGDNYYYLLTRYVRQFKGAREIPVYYRQNTVDISDFSEMRSSKSAFYDDLYDTMHRDHVGVGEYYYTDNSGRNDFEEVRVESDDENIYFYVRTVDDITPPEGTNWMNLLLNTDADYTTGWHGYDFIVNRSINGKKTSIESYGADGTYAFTAVGEASINFKGKEMIISVPKKIVNISSEKFTVDFKFADNIPEEDDIMLFIDKGDVAPNNRFNYRYNFDPDASKLSVIAIVFIVLTVGIVAVVCVLLIKKNKCKSPN